MFQRLQLIPIISVLLAVSGVCQSPQPRPPAGSTQMTTGENGQYDAALRGMNNVINELQNQIGATPPPPNVEALKASLKAAEAAKAAVEAGWKKSPSRIRTIPPRRVNGGVVLGGVTPERDVTPGGGIRVNTPEAYVDNEYSCVLLDTAQWATDTGNGPEEDWLAESFLGALQLHEGLHTTQQYLSVGKDSEPIWERDRDELLATMSNAQAEIAAYLMYIDLLKAIIHHINESGWSASFKLHYLTFFNEVLNGANSMLLFYQFKFFLASYFYFSI